jgi:hypothetical protein
MHVARRLRQLGAALTARVRPEERDLLARTLTPAELRLFERMPLFDQRHSLDVYYTLARTGHLNPALLRAALLHDCGKVDDDGRPIPLLYYGLFVVIRRLAPALYERAVRHGRGPLRPFAVHAQHDTRSALLVEAAGGDAEVIGILRQYAARQTTSLTSALSWADNQN